MITAVALLFVSTAPSVAQDFDWRQFEGETINGILFEGPLASGHVEPQLREFQELTGITVRVEKLTSGQARQKLDIVLAGKDPSVDFFHLQMDERGGAYTIAGYLENLEPYIDNPSLTPPGYDYHEDWAQGCVATTNVVRDAPLNNLVFSAQAQLLHIRQDLFQEHGVKIPETLDELAEAAEKLTIRDANGNIETYGFLSRGSGLEATASFATYLSKFRWLLVHGGGRAEEVEHHRQGVDRRFRILRQADPRPCAGGSAHEQRQRQRQHLRFRKGGDPVGAEFPHLHLQ